MRTSKAGGASGDRPAAARRQRLALSLWRASSCPPSHPRFAMRILIVSLRGPTNAARRGGAQDYVRGVAAPWVRDGHDVTVVCAQEALPEGGTPPEVEVVDGIEVVRVGTPGRPRGAARGRGEGARLWRRRRRGEHHGLPAGAAVAAAARDAARRHQAPLSGRDVRAEPGLAPRDGGPRARRRPAAAGVPRHPARRAERDDGRARPPAVDAAPGAAARHPAAGGEASGARGGQSRSEAPTILYLGALHLSRKRVDHLITAFEQVRQRLPETRLVIAGDGPDRAALEAQASGVVSSHGDSITFAGFVSDEEKARLMAEAWVFASPSLQEGLRHHMDRSRRLRSPCRRLPRGRPRHRR